MSAQGVPSVVHPACPSMGDWCQLPPPVTYDFQVAGASFHRVELDLTSVPGLCTWCCIQGDLGKRQHLHIKTKNVRISIKWSSLRDMLKVCMWQGAL